MKKQYALLRNNKQIGLYTLKEIARIDLFSTDLIWVQGKSIAWHSPEQIGELKRYVQPAPQVMQPQAAQVIEPQPDVNQTKVTTQAEVREASVKQNNYTDKSTAAASAVHTKSNANQAENSETEIKETEGSAVVAPSVIHPKAAVTQIEVAPKIKEAEAIINGNKDTSSSSAPANDVQPEPTVTQIEVAPKIKEAEVIINGNKDTSSSSVPANDVQPDPTVTRIEVAPEIKEAEGILDGDKDTSSFFVPANDVQAEPAVTQVKIDPVTEVVEAFNGNKDTNISSANASVIHPNPAAPPTEVAPEIKEAEAIVDEDKDISSSSAPLNDVQPEPVITPIEVAPEIKEAEVILNENRDTRSYSEPLTVVQPEPAVTPMVVAPKTEVVKPILPVNNDLDRSTVAPSVMLPKRDINPVEDTSKTEVKEGAVARDNDTGKPYKTVYVVPPKPTFNVNEATRQNNDKSKSVAAYVVAPKPAVDINETIEQNDDTSKSVAAYVVPPKPAFDVNETKPDNDTSKSGVSAYVVQPKQAVNRVEVAPKFKKTEEAAGINKETKLLSPERQVFVRFPAGIPPFAFDRKEEAFEDTLEKKPLEMSNTKIYAAKPNPEAENDQPEVKYNRSLEDIKAEYSAWLKQQKGYLKGRAANKPLATTILVVVVSSLSFILWRTINAKTTPVKQVTEQQAKKVEKAAGEKPASDYDGQVKADMPANTVSNEVATEGGLVEDADKELVATSAKHETKDETSAVENSKVKVANVLKKDEEIKIATVEKPVAHDAKAEITTLPATIPQPTSPVQSAENVPVSLTSQVDVKGNVVSGKKQGISALDLTVNNGSNIALTLVAVDVFYYKKDKTLLNKQTIYFSNVKPGSRMTLGAPENKEAAYAEWQLGLISSSGNGITYAKQ